MRARRSDDEARAGDRNEHQHSRKLGLGRKQHGARSDQREPGRGRRAPPALGDRGAHEHGAGEQLPEARRRQIERSARVALAPPEKERQRRDGDDRDRRRKHLLAHGEPHQHRPEQIELLLDAERPEVDERLQLGDAVEVADVVVRDDVGDEEAAADRVDEEIAEVVGRQERRADRSGRREHDQKRRKDPPHPSRVEAREREVGREQDPRDQEAADDEEDVDADEAAAKRARPGVVGDDREHGDCAQAVDVGAIGGRAHSARSGALIIPRFGTATEMAVIEPSPTASPITVRLH
jgi:hypothetical protein